MIYNEHITCIMIRKLSFSFRFTLHWSSITGHQFIIPGENKLKLTIECKSVSCVAPVGPLNPQQVVINLFLPVP